MNVVELRGLRKRFGALEALRGIDLDIPAGGVYGLIGPNGAGKTTLFSIMLGFLRPSDGEVKVLGRAPRELYELQGKIGALPQDADLPPTVTAEQALLFFGRLAGVPKAGLGAEITRVLDLVGLRDRQKSKLAHLSHGMKKRLFIAQALLGKPELVVLDEPTAGLDPKHAHELGQRFQELARSTTIIISSHNLSELEHLCDRAAILVKGEVVRAGTMDEIRRADEEVHIVLGAGPFDEQALGQALPNIGLSFSAEQRRVTLRFVPTGERSSDAVTTQALGALIAQGATIRAVERGQSLLQTYLEVS